MPKNLEAPPEVTQGDVVKANVDGAMRFGMKSIWSQLREVGFSGFAKGAALAGLVVIGVMALVGGFMGADSTLAVGGQVMRTFEGGAAAGIEKGIQFLFSGLGLGTLVAGGVMGAVSEVKNAKHQIADVENIRMALESGHRLGHAHEQQRAPRTYNHEHHHHDHHHHAAPKPEQPDQSIYVKGTMHKTDTYASAELVRRSQRETVMQGGIA